MVSLQTIDSQLKQAGCSIRLWGRTEVHELTNILMPQEVIAQCVNGYYEGGFGMLCVTNHRLILIDRKPLFLTLEDIRFDMISEVDYYFGLMSATVRVMTPNQTLRFSSLNQIRLRKLATMTQEHVLKQRNQQYLQYQFHQARQQYRPTSQYQIDESNWVPSRTVPVRKIASLALRAQDKVTQPLAATAGADGLSTNTKWPVNTYNKVPLLSRRRHFPPFY